MKLFGNRSGMKRHRSRGGQVSFELPVSWSGAPDPEGNGDIFWDPKYPTAGLRLSVLTFERPGDQNPAEPPFPDRIRAAAEPPELLGPGHWITKAVDVGEEDGVQFPFIVYYHLIVRGSRTTVVIFTSSNFPPEIEAKIEGWIRSATIT